MKNIKIILIAAAVIIAALMILTACGKGGDTDGSMSGTGTQSAPADTAGEASSDTPAAPAAVFAAEVGDELKFGKYEQNDNEDDGAEEIEWVVLAKEEGKILVISKYGIEGMEVHDKDGAVTWGESELRAWLNGEFFDGAFTAEEKAAIAETNVKATANPSADTDPGSDVTDRVFLLSIGEVGEYFEAETDRICSGTDYAYANGVFKTVGGGCWWWLRTPGGTEGTFAGVDGNGLISSAGNAAHLVKHAVRPAMWLVTG